MTVQVYVMTMQKAGRLASAVGAAILAWAPNPGAQTTPAADVTFTRDIAPILQRSCQTCHRPDSLAPMSLITYEEVRPYARAIKQRTSLRNRQGVMPPWFIEKNIGIQHFKDDISLSEAEITTIARWADSGAPRGNPADLPPPRVFADASTWQIGTPDLIVNTPPVDMKTINPDWWGALPAAETGLSEDRYIAAIEIKEANDSRNKTGRATVGGLFIFHHAVMSVNAPDGRASGAGSWPVHEVGRNADIFDPDAGRLLPARSTISFPSVHLHANGKDTRAYLQIGFKLHPVGYKPKVQAQLLTIGTGAIDLPGMTSGISVTAYQTLSQPTKLTVFEPHMHAAGVRMCLEAIYGSHVETLNCSGYDHSWVRTYVYADDRAPLLPRGTILRVTGHFDNTAANKNVVDPRNWSGLGHRSIDNMMIMIGQAITLTDDEFAVEVAKRRTKLSLREGQSAPGCPLCAFGQLPGRPRPAAGAQQ
jgi:mono/diheme cytochrome c family protein